MVIIPDKFDYCLRRCTQAEDQPKLIQDQSNTDRNAE